MRARKFPRQFSIVRTGSDEKYGSERMEQRDNVTLRKNSSRMKLPWNDTSHLLVILSRIVPISDDASTTGVIHIIIIIHTFQFISSRRCFLTKNELTEVNYCHARFLADAGSAISGLRSLSSAKLIHVFRAPNFHRYTNVNCVFWGFNFHVSRRDQWFV